MSTRSSKLERGDATARAAWARGIAPEVVAGQLAVFPLETVYCVATSGGSEEGLARLRAATGHQGSSTWHVPDAAAAMATLCGGAGAAVAPMHRRLLRRLGTGPVRFEAEFGQSAPDAARAAGLLPGAADRDGRVAFRSPEDSASGSVWRAGPIVASGVVHAGWSVTGRELRGEAVEAALARGVLAGAFDDGATRLGIPSTTVRLGSDGGYTVTAVGAVPKGAVDRAAVRRVLFVCTGNTCRSPMAEAIGKHLLGQALETGGIPIEVSSAGVSAYDGGAASPEVEAALGRAGVEFDGFHRSRGLTAAMLREADAVFAMTAAHAEAARAIDPASGSKVRPVDPSGDVPDPIGMGQSAYDETAARLRVAVEGALRAVIEEDDG